tara:strand:- start:109 stop:1488 length:1380 start_codon:yes stop_codon:yes gene_type:complete
MKTLLFIFLSFIYSQDLIVSSDLEYFDPNTTTIISLDITDSSLIGSVISDLNVEINLNGNSGIELLYSRFQLLSPDNIVISLAHGREVGDYPAWDNNDGGILYNTVFDDESPTFIYDGFSPFPGYYYGDQLLSNFDNSSILGSWSLLVQSGYYQAAGEASFTLMFTLEEYGCTDQVACNFDEDATLDDSSCEYAQENFDCDGNCISEIDCNGVCGGEAVIDDCGICEGFNDCLGCTDPYASNYNENATIDDGSCIYGYEESMQFIFEPTSIYNPDNGDTMYYLDIRAQSSTSEVGGIQIEIQDIPNLITFDWYGYTDSAFDFVDINDNGSLSFMMLNTNQEDVSEEEFLLIQLGFRLDNAISEQEYGEIINLILETILVGDFNADPIQPLSNDPIVNIGYKGDVSLDGSINVSDIISGVNIILNDSTPSDYQLWACDLNEDSYNNVYDIILIINLILAN